MPADQIIQTRIDGAIKQEAATVLTAMGLTLSDAVRLMLTRVAQDKKLPFEPLPNDATLRATRAAKALSSLEKATYLKAIEQTDAIFAFEGFRPTEQSKAIDAAILAGRITTTQAIEEMREYIMAHKTFDGFLESRSWV
jgi:DNA-damage-inducible protein J